MSNIMYSPEISGDEGNYEWAVHFDKTGKPGATKGYLGITQLEKGKVKERVLLSPDQVTELAKFIKKKIRTSIF
ncbi:hypothetical protein LCGC14_1667330 [marine sediment metagenome]|uniref:Uncharacterized protein n=1 Tax=marine sediment metagenome TaxID=412755 RepID=A0A0F9IEX1_9ZZZZ